MSTMTAEFIGGPLDGMVRELPPGEGINAWGPNEPPLSVLISILLSPTQSQPPIVEGEPLQIGTVQYLRRVNPREDGVLWEYLYVPS